jgi:uncharacterized repeat protein (TIGR01451 family)
VFTKMFNRKLLFALLAMVMISVLVLSGCGSSGPPASSTTAPPSTAASRLTILSLGGGNVLVQKPGSSEWLKGVEGMTLEVNFKVKTDQGSKATITFFEGSTIEIDGDTILSLAELGLSGQTTTIKVKQEIGQTVSHVQKLVDSASRYEIETTAAVAAVRGTIVFVGSYANGNTVVGNLEGLVSVLAQGVEVTLTPNTHSTVTPGNAPGPAKPGATPSPTPTPTPTPTIAENPALKITSVPDKTQGFPGDTLNYTYTLVNSGDVPLSSITLQDDITGTPTFKSGDANSNSVLEVGETWIYTASYFVKNEESGALTNSVTASGSTKSGKKATASNLSTVNILFIEINITSMKSGDTVGANITLAGSVNDKSITEATVNLNGTDTKTPVSGGNFSLHLTLQEGDNKLTITVNKPGGITSSVSFDLVPAH